MSRIRTGLRPEDWLIVDEGMTPHPRSRGGIRGGGPPIVNGSLVVGESQYSYARRAEREYKARMKVEP